MPTSRRPDVAAPLLARLREATRPLHDRLEADLDLLNPTLSRDRYRELLEGMWGFYQPLEARLAPLTAWDECGFDFERRRKTLLLERDLRGLGVEREALAALPRCDFEPGGGSFGGALGCLYVLEGATLGGQVMSRHLKETLGLGPENGCAFFNSYGAQVGPMWTAFREFLTFHGAGRGVEEAVVEGACETFCRLHGWLTEQEGRMAEAERALGAARR